MQKHAWPDTRIRLPLIRVGIAAFGLVAGLVCGDFDLYLIGLIAALFVEEDTFAMRGGEAADI